MGFQSVAASISGRSSILRTMNRVMFALLAMAICFASSNCVVLAEDDEQLIERGRVIYSESCSDCHGEKGQGVEGAYETPLIGDESIGQLGDRIAKTMPEGDVESCVGEDAEAVAAFIHQAFYSEAAQVRNRPPRVGLARLTGEQLRQSLSDIYAGMFAGNMWAKPERGVKAVYFNSDRWKKEELKLDTVVPAIDFDFGHEAPIEGVDAKKFYIMFQGGLRVDESGLYQIIVDSTCSFVMDFGRDGRKLINNHVQSGDKTLFQVPLRLTGGRTYPFKIDFIQRERKTESPPAKISLRWITPGGQEEVIPENHLVPGWCPPAFALQTDLPADDRSYGFERGIAINKQWDESTTNAALEFADIATEELWPKFDKDQKDESDRRKKLAMFLTKIAEMAFRFPLTEEMQQRYVLDPLAATEDDSEAIKRSLLITLKSPYFLYPGVAKLVEQPPQRAAAELALTMFDSLPNEKRLWELASQEKLSEKQLRDYLWGAVNDNRFRGKMYRFLHYWLNVDSTKEIAKSQELYPGFDSAVVYDLRRSLDLFLQHVYDSEKSDYRQLYTTDRMYTSPSLREFYGDAWAVDPEHKDLKRGQFEVSIPAENRFGVLTHPYVTSSLAYHDTTSPIHRGVFLIRYVLGRNLRPPSAAFAPLSPDLHPDLTTRQRVEKQTSPENCQACHIKINGLGFALENFDAVGRFRSKEKGKDIDPTGDYVDRDGNRVEFTGPAELAKYLTESPDAHRAFVNKMFQYFVKQPPAAYGPDTLDRLTSHFQSSGFNIRGLAVEIAVTVAMDAQESSLQNGEPSSDVSLSSEGD